MKASQSVSAPPFAGSPPGTLPILLASTALALAFGAIGAMVIGWFWAHSRGDWQAYLLWSYWGATPFVSGVSLAVAKRHRLLRLINVSLLSLWGAVSLVVLVLPFLG